MNVYMYMHVFYKCTCTCTQVHLGEEPYLICVFVTCAEAKVIAGNLSKKYLLDSDFYNPRSSDVSEQYILLTLEDAPSPQEISTLVEVGVTIAKIFSTNI